MDSFRFSRYRWKIARGLVWLANRLVKPPKDEWKYNYWPKFRPIDQAIKHEGSFKGTEHACGAYSYEHLKSFSEQDGPDGPSAKETVKRFISEEGWVNLSDMSPREITRTFAMAGMDVEFPDEAYEDATDLVDQEDSQAKDKPVAS